MIKRPYRLTSMLWAMVRFVCMLAVVWSAISPADDSILQEFACGHSHCCRSYLPPRAARQSLGQITGAAVITSLFQTCPPKRICTFIIASQPAFLYARAAVTSSYRAPPAVTAVTLF